jgi:hypothetical protein
MSFESRVDFLLRAAERADREETPRLADIFRRMAAELKPVEAGAPAPPLSTYPS